MRDLKQDEFIGKTFNRLTVLAFDSMRRPGEPLYLCECECGNKKAIRKNSIKSGHTKSCGCLNKEIIKAAKNNYRHGKSKTRIHNIWWEIIERCTNEKNQAYKNYGGRGIQVCEEWRNSFEKFDEWSADNGYDKTLSIDRINNDGNYEPNNCRWATRKEQNNNKRNNHKIEIDGVVKNLSEWAAFAEIHRSTIHRRLKRGITGSDLISKKAVR